MHGALAFALLFLLCLSFLSVFLAPWCTMQVEAFTFTPPRNWTNGSPENDGFFQKESPLEKGPYFSGSMLNFRGVYEPGSKLVVLGMVIPPLIGNPYNGYINPYYWVDDHPLLYGNNGSLDPSTYENFSLEPRKKPLTFHWILAV